MVAGLVWLVLARSFQVLSEHLPSARNESVLSPGSSADVHGFNSLKSAMIDEVISKELAANRCKWSFRSKPLRDAFFHMNETGLPVPHPDFERPKQLVCDAQAGNRGLWGKKMNAEEEELTLGLETLDPPHFGARLTPSVTRLQSLHWQGHSMLKSSFHGFISGSSSHIHGCQVPPPKCAEITNVKSDVFANRMDVSLTLPRLTVKGDVSFGEVRSNRDGDGYPFGLDIYNARGSGLCFSKWTGTGYEIVACDIRYDIPKTFKMSTPGARFPVEDTAFVHASVNRLWKGVTNAMSENVVEGLNRLVRELDVVKYLRNPEMFQKYRNYVIQSTESANEFVDGIMDSVRRVIKEKFRDSFDIPEIHEGFRKKVLVVTWRGSFTADHGTVRGLSTVTRVGDTAFATDNASRTHFFGNLSFEKLDLHYDRYRAEFMSFGPTGTLNTRLEPIRLHIHPFVDFDTGKIYLEDFEIEDVGDIVVEVTGLGTALNWVVSKISTWVVGLARDKILGDLQRKYDSYIKCVLSGYTIRDITDGRVFARP